MIDSRFRSFEKLYEKIPGVMAICEEEVLEDTILVYIDRDFFSRTSLPKKYQEASIDIIDAYEQLSALNNAFDKIKEHYKDDLTATPVSHFEGMIGFLKVVIELYEEKQEKE